MSRLFPSPFSAEARPSSTRSKALAMAIPSLRLSRPPAGPTTATSMLVPYSGTHPKKSRTGRRHGPGAIRRRSPASLVTHASPISLNEDIDEGSQVNRSTHLHRRLQRPSRNSRRLNSSGRAVFKSRVCLDGTPSSPRTSQRRRRRVPDSPSGGDGRPVLVSTSQLRRRPRKHRRSSQSRTLPLTPLRSTKFRRRPPLPLTLPSTLLPSNHHRSTPSGNGPLSRPIQPRP